MSWSITFFKGFTINFGNVTGHQMNSDQSVGGNMTGDQTNSGQMDAGPNPVCRTNARQDARRRRNARPSTRGTTNAGQMIIARDLTINHSENASSWVWVNDPSETSVQSVGGNMIGDQTNSGQMDAGPNLVGSTNAGPNPVGRTNARQDARRRRNARPSNRGTTNAGQMIIARDLTINHSENASCWVWVNDPSETRFTEVAKLLGDKLLSIKATKNLVGLAETKYGAYLIFKTKKDSKCLGNIQKAIIVKSDSLRESTAIVLLSLFMMTLFDRKYLHKCIFLLAIVVYYRVVIAWDRIELQSDVCLKPLPKRMPLPFVGRPVKRSDGWMELQLGQFNCYEAIGNNYVVISIEDTNTDNKKTGLLIAGIEIRPIETAKYEGGSTCFDVLLVILLIFFVYAHGSNDILVFVILLILLFSTYVFL